MSKASELLDRYLSQVRAGLRSLPSEQVDEILRELRSHIVERAGERGGLDTENVRTTLQALGDPVQLAGQYLTENLFSRTAATRSPLLMAQSLFHWGTLSLEGFAIASVSLLLYLVGITCLTMAATKLFKPDETGVWLYADPAHPDVHTVSINLGLGPHSAAMAGHEIFGWWLVPLGLLIGLSLIFATYRVDLAFIGRFHRRGHDLD